MTQPQPHLWTTTHPKDTQPAVRRHLQAVKAQTESEDTPNLLPVTFQNILCSTKAEADEYLRAHCEPGAGAIAIKMKDYPAGTNKHITKLKEQMQKAQRKLSALPEPEDIEMEAFRRAQKIGKNIRCLDCSSTINTNRIETTACPVCGHEGFVMRTGDYNKVAKLKAQKSNLEERINNWQTKIEQIRAKHRHRPGHWFWYIGASHLPDAE